MLSLVELRGYGLNGDLCDLEGVLSGTLIKLILRTLIVYFFDTDCDRIMVCFEYS